MIQIIVCPETHFSIDTLSRHGSTSDYPVPGGIPAEAGDGGGVPAASASWTWAQAGAQPVRGVADALDQSPDEGLLGLGLGDPVLLLDEEQVRQPAGQGVVDQLLVLGALFRQPVEPGPQQPDHVVRVRRADQRQRRDETRVLVHGFGEEAAQPVPQLVAAGVGDGVDGPLRALARAGRRHLGDEACLRELRHHHVQRAVLTIQCQPCGRVPQAPGRSAQGVVEEAEDDGKTRG